MDRDILLPHSDNIERFFKNELNANLFLIPCILTEYGEKGINNIT